MTVEIAIGRYSRARFWFEEWPALDFTISEIIIEEIERVNSTIQPKLKRLAVELFIPHSGFARYGLLGVLFVPSSEHNLMPKVPVCNEQGGSIEWSLASSIDHVYSGLLKEYATAVIVGARSNALITNLGFGTLYFGTAAHGLIGSSLFVMQ